MRTQLLNHLYMLHPMELSVWNSVIERSRRLDWTALEGASECPRWPACSRGWVLEPTGCFLDCLGVLSTNSAPEKFMQTSFLLLVGCFFRFVDQLKLTWHIKQHRRHLYWRQLCPRPPSALRVDMYGSALWAACGPTAWAPPRAFPRYHPSQDTGSSKWTPSETFLNIRRCDLKFEGGH